MSIDPRRPADVPVMTSGDMYMGVPVIEFPLTFEGAAVATLVLPCLAMTLAAPKSTYFIIPWWSRRISAMVGVSYWSPC